MSFEVDTSEFTQSLLELDRFALGTDRDVVTISGRELIFNLVNATPRRSGNARAGWTAGWQGIGRNGKPFRAAKVGRKRRYIAEGAFVDNRNTKGEPSVEFINQTRAITKAGVKRRKSGKNLRGEGRSEIYYIFLLDAGKLRHPRTGGVVTKHKGFVQKALDKTADFFFNVSERKYASLLRRFSV